MLLVYTVQFYNQDKSLLRFNESPPAVLCTVQELISVQIQLSSIHYIELLVSTYLRSSTGSQFVFKTY